MGKAKVAKTTRKPALSNSLARKVAVLWRAHLTRERDQIEAALKELPEDASEQRDLLQARLDALNEELA